MLELAKKSGLCWSSDGKPMVSLENLENFAKLISAKEKQRCVGLIKDFTPRSGHQTPEYLFAQKLIAAIEVNV